MREVPLMKCLYQLFSCLFLLMLLSACANQPTVYVYAKYLDDEQRNELTEQLEKEDLQVKLNEFDFPTTISTNTLLYSLLLQDEQTIDTTSDVTKRLGFPINSTASITQGNHWYTKNSLAIFLFPDGQRPADSLLPQDLVHVYVGEGCGDGKRLILHKNGTYTLELNREDENTGDSVTATGNGQWKFRQFPYLELQEAGAHYANYYFEISQNHTADKVSDLVLTSLTLINDNSANPLAETCVFEFGERI